jgi:hypothetical protein
MNMIAVRALARVLEPYDQAEAYDRHWDGGEWSGPAHARLRLEAIGRVAQRFGMTADQLWGDLYEASCINQDKLQEARIK